MYLYRTKSKRGKPHSRWRFQYTDWQGRRRSATGTTSKAETAKIAAQVQAKEDGIRKGWYPPPKASSEPRVFEQVTAEYMRWGIAQGGRRGHGWSEWHIHKRRTFLNWWQDRLNLRLLSDLDCCLPKVEKALIELHKNKKAGKTVNAYAEGLSAFCDWCCVRSYLDADPLARLKSFEETPKSRRRAMTAKEILALMNHCAPERKPVYLLALGSGFRAKEIRCLQVKHLDLRMGGLYYSEQWTKNRQSGVQYVGDGLLDMLAEMNKGKNPNAKLLRVSTHLSRELDKDLEAAKIQKHTPMGKIDFHSLRVTFCTLVDQVGATEAEAQAMARHTPQGLTYRVYIKPSLKRLKELAELVWDVLVSACENITIAQRKVAGLETQELERSCVELERDSSPLSSTIQPETKSGPKAETSGPFLLEAGPSNIVTKSNSAKIGLSRTPLNVEPGNAGNTIKAQREHHRSITVEGLPLDVVEGLRNWNKLPEHVRTAVKALLKGAAE